MSHPSSSVNTLHSSFLFIFVMLCCIRTTRSSHPFRQATAFINSNMSNATHTDKKAKLSTYPMELTSRPAQCNLVPPGVCQFTPTFTSVPLLDRVPAGEGGTSYILRFGLPDGEKSMGLTTCACVLACAELEDREKGEKVPVIRPYTPISTNDQVGSFDLLVKDYKESGFLSKYMCEDLPIGGEIQFKHIDFNVKIPAPFKHKKIGMIAGGTGITPMIQALHAILGSGPEDQKSSTEEVTLLYGSRNKFDILGGDMLSTWASKHSNFNYLDVLSHEPENSTYEGLRGFIDKEKIEQYLPKPSEEDVIIFVCGPPIMYELLCGPRNETEVKGVLGELGYSAEQVFKF